jgi:hypothetical protein
VPADMVLASGWGRGLGSGFIVHGGIMPHRKAIGGILHMLPSVEPPVAGW